MPRRAGSTAIGSGGVAPQCRPYEHRATRDALSVYEDHGGDPACRVTQFALDELNLTVLHPSEDGTIEHITPVGSARSAKTNPNRGYDFVTSPRDGAFAPLITAVGDG